MKKQSGISIVECLLAITFATALIWQVFVIYKDVHQTHRLQAAMSGLLHHGQWFEDVMGARIRFSGDMSCVPKAGQSQLIKHIVQAYPGNQVPADWGIHAAKQASVLVLATCQKNTMNTKLHWQKTAYYLKKNALNKLYTLYQKPKGSRAMAMQDNIQSLQWYLAFQAQQKGAVTAPQDIGVDNPNQVRAIAWKVTFSTPNKVLVHLNKPLTRTFYGYMSLHNLLN